MNKKSKKLSLVFKSCYHDLFCAKDRVYLWTDCGQQMICFEKAIKMMEFVHMLRSLLFIIKRMKGLVKLGRNLFIFQVIQKSDFLHGVKNDNFQ